MQSYLVYLAPLVGIIGLATAFLIYRAIMRQPAGEGPHEDHDRQDEQRARVVQGPGEDCRHRNAKTLAELGPGEARPAGSRWAARVLAVRRRARHHATSDPSGRRLQLSGLPEIGGEATFV